MLSSVQLFTHAVCVRYLMPARTATLFLLENGVHDGTDFSSTDACMYTNSFLVRVHKTGTPALAVFVNALNQNAPFTTLLKNYLKYHQSPSTQRLRTITRLFYLLTNPVLQNQLCLRFLTANFVSNCHLYRVLPPDRPRKYFH